MSFEYVCFIQHLISLDVFQFMKDNSILRQMIQTESKRLIR